MRGRRPTAVLEKLFGTHSLNLQRAMSKATQRQSLLSQNLANGNTPGYQRKDIDFDIRLEAEEQKGLRRSPLLSGRSQSGGPPSSNGNSVDLEKEVVAIAETELRFQTLAELTSRHFSGLKSVIRGGR